MANKEHLLAYFAKTGGRITAGIAFILLILFLIPLIGSHAWLALPGTPKINATALLINRSAYWIGLILLWPYSHKIEKQNLLIWKEKKQPYLIVIGSIVIMYAIMLTVSILIKLVYPPQFLKVSPRLLMMMDIMRKHPALMVFTALTAGFVEEIIFRGYLQPRLELLYKNAHLSIFITSALFGLLHFGYGTALNMIIPFFIGLMLSYHYRKYRNLKILIIFHTLWDLVAMVALLRMHR